MGELTIFLPLLIIMGAFMFFASRRQKKAMQATIDLQNSLTVGDRVMTTSGQYGTIAAVENDTIDIEIAPGIVTTWTKLAVRDVVKDEDGLDDDRDDDDFDDDDYETDTTENSGAVELNKPGTASEANSDPGRLTKD
ncbi:MAG: preprotein translocase subunit YajC [Mycobacterium sp.]